MKATMLLCDYAEAINGKLYIMGGGWSVTGPDPNPSAIAIRIEVPWDEANKQHELQLELLTDDGQPVKVQTITGEMPMAIGGNFEVGRPPGLKPGTPLDVAVAMNIGPIPLPPGRSFVWRLSINGETNEDWRLTFSTRPQKQS